MEEQAIASKPAAHCLLQEIGGARYQSMQIKSSQSCHVIIWLQLKTAKLLHRPKLPRFRVMELESVQATTGMLPKTVAKSDSSEDQVLRTAVAEIGSIQEQENQPRYRAALHQETKCSSKVCFYRFIGPQEFGPVLELKPSMSRAREIGQELLNGKVLPLFSTYGREIWTYLQFLIILGFAVKSIVIDIAVSDPNERTAVDFVLLSFSLMFLLLSILDVCITIYIHRCCLLCTPCRCRD